MKIGYLRVSTEEQRPDRQIDALEPICDELHIERQSAVSAKRPVFDSVIANLREGDTLVVWDLDRAFRSTVDALVTAERLCERGVEFRIVTLGVDTATADGKLVYTVIAAFAEHERNRLSERTKQGLRAAVKRGKVLGRKPILSDAQLKDAAVRIERRECSLAQMAARYGVHPRTLSRGLKRLGAGSSERALH